MESTKISLFEGKKVRRVIHGDEWWFSVVDVVEALTDSSNPRVYWAVMKERLEKDEKIQLFTFCKQLKLESSDGKKYETDCANTEGVFRLVQSFPRPRLSRLSAGWRVLGTSEFRRLKILNWHKIE